MKLSFRHIAVIIALGLLGWALCGAVMFIGTAALGLETTLVIHAIAAPIIFAAISWFYFTRLAYTRPLTTAVAFTSVVIFMDFFLVALVINRSFDMFRSLIGTWVPFALIFLSTYITGLAIKAPGGLPATERTR